MPTTNQRYFTPGPARPDLRVQDVGSLDVRQEVLYEEQQTRITHRPLYVGTAFSPRRFLMAGIGCAVLLVALMGRAFSMQILDQEAFAALADNNRLRTIPEWPRRGIIRDRQGAILADNTTRFQVLLTPRDVPQAPDDQQIILGNAARLLGISIRDLDPLVHVTGTARDEPVLVADQVGYAQAMAFAIEEPELPGFRLIVRPRRRYPLSEHIPSLSHVLGYVGRISEEEYGRLRAQDYRRADELGKTGIERAYESALRGTMGKETREVDARGRAKATVGREPAVDGQDIVLSLDAELQERAEKALRAGLVTAKTTRGAVIAMDPRDGSVLAAVSWPAYNNNQFAGSVSSTVYRALVQNPDQPLFPRAWAGTYPSGSTVKIVMSAAALAEKIITPNTTVHSTGGIRLGPWFFPDWKAGGHGVVNVKGAIAWSVNTFFYTIGGGTEAFQGLGIDRMEAWLRAFGMGEKTGIDVAGEGTGFVPSKAWKERVKKVKWFVGDSYNLSIGQGDLLVTPLQVALYTSMIANGGYRVTPHVSKQGVPRPEHPVVSQDVLQVVRDGMRETVTVGSGRALATMAFPVSGKTGTAQWNSNKNTHAWFTAFAPSPSPEVVVTVLLEEGGEGSAVAVPVARQVLEAWWSLREARGGSF